ncbi:Hypothetical protein LUCI_2677 [Lucifera butyrica]|uniref:Uncharacterized protein n=1 Tax=Lucifera butyrica TaxID=1351585 RepID=A0A498RE12_9FIRM|nr:HAD family phosphatase [Lucifera butyrica]VBB07428.1 Hypothetical protein LUCI_2677 [Lucifera butyrica]
MIKGVIFDMDGVIIDSEPLHHKIFMQYTRSELGLAISEEEYNTFIGSTNLYMFSTLKAKYGIKKELTTLIADYEQRYVDYLLTAPDEKPLAGVDLLINKLSSQVKLALASSSPRKHIDIILNMFHLTDLFAVKISGLEVANSKPAPDIFLRAAELLALPPEQCLIIEDSKNGVTAAKTAGMKCLGFYNPNSGAQDLSRADRVIKDFNEIITRTDWLLNL